MDLKFTFGGASSDDNGRDDAPSGIPLPFSTTPGVSTSSVLELHARLADGALSCAATSPDGVEYASASVTVSAQDPASLARALRSGVSRAVAGLEGPLAEAITAIVLDLGGSEVEVLGELGISTIPFEEHVAAVVSDDFQRRTGVASGTPIRTGV